MRTRCFPSTVRCLSTRRRWQPESLAEGALCVVCLFILCPSRCDSKADDDTVSLATNADRSSHASHQHARSHLKTSSLMNSSHNLTAAQHQQLLAQLLRIDNQKKNHLSTTTLASLLQKPIQSRSLSVDPNDPLQQKIKRFKSSHKKINHVGFDHRCERSQQSTCLLQTDKLTQLLSSPTAPNVYTTGLASNAIPPQSILERLSPSNVVFSPAQQQQIGRRRLKNALSGTVKQGKGHRNLSSNDLRSLADSTPTSAILLKAQFLEAARKLQQKEVRRVRLNCVILHRRIVLGAGEQRQSSCFATGELVCLVQYE